MTECYLVEPIVAVVPLVKQILTIMSNKTLLITINNNIQVQVFTHSSYKSLYLEDCSLFSEQ
jgi:hypothetical protein